MLARIVGIFGPFPEDMLARGRHAHKYFANGVVFERDRAGRIELLQPKPSPLRHRLHTVCDLDSYAPCTHHAARTMYSLPTHRLLAIHRTTSSSSPSSAPCSACTPTTDRRLSRRCSTPSSRRATPPPDSSATRPRWRRPQSEREPEGWPWVRERVRRGRARRRLLLLSVLEPRSGGAATVVCECGCFCEVRFDPPFTPPKTSLRGESGLTREAGSF